jgi:hypothetical protein
MTSERPRRWSGALAEDEARSAEQSLPLRQSVGKLLWGLDQ